jgi:hypothetical protein
LLLLFFGCAPHGSRMIARLTSESQVRLAQRQRFEAMTKQDVAALDTLLDDELDYVHAGGTLESRQQFLDVIKNGTLVYESIETSQVRVRVYDDIALAMYTEPPLTTVKQPVREIGKLATELIMARVNGERKEPQSRRLKTSLVVRGSCGIKVPAHPRPKAKQQQLRSAKVSP